MRLRKGQYVRIEFTDHAEDCSEPLVFVVVGQVSVVSRRHVCVDTWFYADEEMPYDENVKRFVILRSTIRSLTQLVPADETLDSSCGRRSHATDRKQQSPSCPRPGSTAIESMGVVPEE
jgi:hypothetical protein